MATWFAQNSSVNIDSANMWNSAANGSGSFLTWASLAAADVLVANGKTAISINVDITPQVELTTEARGGTAGGGFTCSTARTINAHLTAGTTAVLVDSHATGTVTINGNILGASGGFVNCLTKSGAGLTVHSGNITGGTFNSGIGVSVASGNFQGTGTVTGGSNVAAHAIQFSGSGTHTITGAIVGGSSTARAVNFLQSSGSLAITGSVSGGTSSSATVLNNSAGTVTISGNVTAGTAVAASGYGAENAATGTLTITGYTQGSASGGTSAGVFGSLPGTTTVGSVRTSSSGVAGIQGKVFLANLTTGTLQGVNSSLTVKTFYPTDFSGLLPSVGDVRSGTTYNLGNSTGTLASGRPSSPFLQQVIG